MDTLYSATGRVNQRIQKELGKIDPKNRSLSPTLSGKVDPLTCSRCSGKMKVISVIEDEEITRLLCLYRT
jgi:hypothetical protein